MRRGTGRHTDGRDQYTFRVVYDSREMLQITEVTRNSLIATHASVLRIWVPICSLRLGISPVLKQRNYPQNEKNIVGKPAPDSQMWGPGPVLYKCRAGPWPLYLLSLSLHAV